MTDGEFSWTVPLDHPAFAGHFPGHPIVPGVLLLDRAILFAGQLSGNSSGRWQVGNCKFLSPVGPGETLLFTLRPKPGGAVAFTLRAGSREVASGSLTPHA